jgi:hypothetical protein
VVQISNSSNEKAEVQIAVNPNNPQQLIATSMKIGSDNREEVGYSTAVEVHTSTEKRCDFPASIAVGLQPTG